MDDDRTDEVSSLSVIPYDQNRDVVLRHADTVVYRDPQTNQLVPYHHDQQVDAQHQHDCPTCGRPWNSRSRSSGQDVRAPPEEQPSFITPDYFDMLARSLPGSNQVSSPPSPRRRIAHLVGSPPSDELSDSSAPPPNAEFVASAPNPGESATGISETAFSPHYFERFFIEERELGRGGRGVVLLVRHILDGVNLGHFACKRVPIGDDHAWLEKVLIEVRVLQGLSHQNLVSYRHVWLEDYQISNFGPSVPCAFILQQYCNSGDMHNYVLGNAQAETTTQELKERIRRRSRGESDLPRRADEPKRLSFDEIYSFFRDITSGLRFLHHHNFIHRDLKPSNCLLHVTGGEMRVLVSDFGEVQYEYATRKSTGATGTISYCAPEVLRRISPGGPYQNFTSKSDIFSLGMILHFLCFANLPYRAANVLHEEREDVELLRAEIMSWGGFDDARKLRPDLPGPLYAFLKRLLSLKPESRPSADDVLQVVTSGRLDEMPSIRRRNSTDPEELTPGKRIQKLDTPTKGNSPARGLGLGIEYRGRRSRLGPRTRSRERAHPGTLSKDMAGSDDGYSSDSESDPSRSHNASRSGSQSHPSLNIKRLNTNTIVLRPRQASAASAPTSPIAKPASPARRSPQLLLEPPRQPPQTRWAVLRQQALAVADLPLTPINLRLSILVVKLLSTLQPCLRQGINAIVVYPLLFVSVLEFTIADLRLWKAVLSMAIHVAVLTVAWNNGVLCEARMIRWED